MKLGKLKGRATTRGQEYEFKLAALLFARLKQRPELRFELATNVVGAEPSDDILLRIRWEDETNTPQHITYLMQLKHSSKRKKLLINSFTAEKGDYSVRRYFEAYKRLVSSEELELEPAANKDEKVIQSNLEYLACYPADEYRILIYTSNQLDSVLVANPPERQTSHGKNSSNITQHISKKLGKGFPYLDSISSNKSDPGLVFSERLESVWNLLNDDADAAEYRHTFLPRFAVLSAQSDSTGLDGLISIELKELFKLSDSQNQRILQKYLDRTKKWWESDDGNLWTNETAVLEEIIVNDISSNFREITSRHSFNKYRFSAESLEELAEKIHRKRISIFSYPDMKPYIRCSKLLQVLDSESEKYVILLDEKNLGNTLHAIISITKTDPDRSYVLLDVHDGRPDTFQTMQYLIQNTRCSIIIFFTFIEKARSFLPEATYVCKVTDPWCMCQLNPEDQREMLEQEVDFQGHRVKLTMFEKKWPTLREDTDGPFLCALAEGSAILGCTLAPHGDGGDVSTLYFPRVIEHRWELKPEALLMDTDSDLFALSGTPKYVLDNLKSERHNRGMAQGILHVLSNEEKTPNPQKDSEQFYQLCNKYPSKNIHHVSYHQNCYIWLSSRGSNSFLIDFLKLRSNFCDSKQPLCQHLEDDTDFSQWEERSFYLSGEPGIGKSTFLKHLSKKNAIANWCVFVPMAHFHSLFQSILENEETVDLDHVLQLLVEAVKIKRCSSARTTKAFLHEALLHTGNMSVYVDGVDEICPRYKELALKLISLLTETKANCIWVSSRNHLDSDLRKLFPHEPLHLRPFSEEQQIDYICQFLSHSDCEYDIDGLKKSVSEIVETMKQHTERRGRLICETPLHTYLLARAYSKLPTRQWTPLLFLRLYQIFVAENIRKYMKKQGIVDYSPDYDSHKLQITEMHEVCALHLLDLDEFVNEGSLHRLLKTRKETNTGILFFIKGEPLFVHYTFAEYFCALWITKNIEKSSEVFWGKMTPLSRDFLNTMLLVGQKLHEAVIGGDMDQINDELSRIGEVDKGGRTALHISAIQGNVKICNLLVQAGADAKVKDKVLEWTALRYADEAKDLDTVDFLLGACFEIADAKKTIEENIRTKGLVFRKAAEKGYLNVVKLFLGLRNDPAVSEEQRSFFLNEGAGGWKKDTPLHTAAYAGHTLIVKSLVETGAPVNARNVMEESPLHLACQSGREETVKYLLAAGAPVNSETQGKRSPLHSACKEGNQEIVKLLIAEGASVNSIDEVGSSPLHYACEWSHLNLVELLLDKGAPVNAVNARDTTPLHKALEVGNQDIVKFLLTKDASISAKDEQGWSPLHYACHKGNRELVELLLSKGAACNAVDEKGDSLLHSACRQGDAGVVSLLLAAGAAVNATNKRGRPPLHYAFEMGHEDVVPLLLAKGAAINAVDKAGWSPLHYACREDNRGLVEMLLDKGASVYSRDKKWKLILHHACEWGRLDLVELFLAKGAPVNAADGRKKSVLHYACEQGHQDLVTLLLEKGASVNAVDVRGKSVLHYACEWGHQGLVDLLLAKGATVNAVDDVGKSILHCACERGHRTLVELLVSGGASVNTVDNCGSTVLHYACRGGNHYYVMEFLLSKGASVNAVDTDSWSALHAACVWGHADIVGLLLDRGASANAIDIHNRTPLHIACSRGHRGAVERLLAHGADVNAVNDLGTSPLHIAARGRPFQPDVDFEAVARLLLQNGADAGIHDPSGLTPLDWAAHEGNRRVMRLLEEHTSAP